MSKVVMVKDSVIFITGTNRKRGLGQALVEEAVRRGAKKVYATARNISQLESLAHQYKGIVVPISLDVTNKSEIDQAALKASDTQILINNSGIGKSTGFCFNYSEEIAREQIEVNYFGLINLIRSFFKMMIKNQNGAIANVISIVGLSNLPFCASYSASKAAAHSLTQAVRAELTPFGIPVFGIYPGPIDTEMSSSGDDAKEKFVNVDAIQKLDREHPINVAIRIFDGIEQGIEDIITDNFADIFFKNLWRDHKELEKELSAYAYKEGR